MIDLAGRHGIQLATNGAYAAYLQDDANFVLCLTSNGAPDLSRPYWSVYANAVGKGGQYWSDSGSAPGPVGQHVGPPYHARMQSDGNFVLYNGKDPSTPGPPYWATNTNMTGGLTGSFTAIIQNDGNFVIYAGTPSGNLQAPGVPAIWASNTQAHPVTPRTPDNLPSDQCMDTDSALISTDGRFAAYFKPDGDFVLCRTANGAPDLNQVYWSAFYSAAGQICGPRPAEPPPGVKVTCNARMHFDGIFRLCQNVCGAAYSLGSLPVYWATSITTQQPARVWPDQRPWFTSIIQTDGNFVIYSGPPSDGIPVWASNTVQR